jgi:hypothetical protein
VAVLRFFIAGKIGLVHTVLEWRPIVFECGSCFKGLGKI